MTVSPAATATPRARCAVVVLDRRVEVGERAHCEGHLRRILVQHRRPACPPDIRRPEAVRAPALSRRRDCHFTGIPSPCSRRFNRHGGGESAKCRNSRRWLHQPHGVLSVIWPAIVSRPSSGSLLALPL